MKKSLLGIIFLFAFLSSCHKENSITAEAHRLEIEAWHEKQMASLKSENGWLNLIGLYWLEEGENSFGSGAEVDLKLENKIFPETLGIFFLEEGKVYFEPKVEGVESEGSVVENKILIFDPEGKINKPLTLGSLHWVIIKRSDAFGVRLRDYEADVVSNFEGVEQYPIDLNWRIEAKFIPYESSKTIPITNVIGQTTENPSPGYLKFQIGDKTFTLDALDGNEEELYLIFADETSGRETYGGGRYMYVKKADDSGNVIIDFNKAYNPPCVYTAHATCPLPPRQNMLEVAITAGHKNYGDH
jgi:uncharacterized protein (DUF1684 family)